MMVFVRCKALDFISTYSPELDVVSLRIYPRCSGIGVPSCCCCQLLSGIPVLRFVDGVHSDLQKKPFMVFDTGSVRIHHK